MARFPANHIPTMRSRPDGRAVVTLSGNDYYLGQFGTRESREAYDRLIGQWIAAGRRLPKPEAERPYLVSDLTAEFLVHACTYYRKGDKVTTTVSVMRGAFRSLVALYGSTPAADLGRDDFEAVVRSWAEGKTIRTKLKFSRKTVNEYRWCVLAAYRWAAQRRKIPAAVVTELEFVPALKAGRSVAREPDEIAPATEADIEAVRAIVCPAVRTMIDLQLQTGMRPGEVVQMRRAEIRTKSGRGAPCATGSPAGDVWAYAPRVHKTQHHGKARVIFFGPRAQALLVPWLERPVDEPMFVLEGFGAYTAPMYRMTIGRACKAAGVAHWHPHQLRHNAATRLDRDAGEDAARVVLGHGDVRVTRIYSSAEQEKAARIMREHG